jgi:hypothetical protein
MYDDLLFSRAAIEATRGHLSGQTRFDDMIEQLYQTARAVCHVIDDFQPDLVVVLAHGAWGVLWATESYWVSSKGTQAFPPVMVTNLGREKMERYEKVRVNLPCAHMDIFIADYASDQEVGYFLSWVEEQQDWIDQFRQQAQAATSVSPERILILDDAVLEGCTYRLAVGLAEAAFPKAAVHFVNGHVLAWRSELAYSWLEKQILGWSEEKHWKITSALYFLSTGTEDVNLDSLAWEPITRQSRIMETVSAYLPAEKWLELPGWMMHTIQARVQERFQYDAQAKPPDMDDPSGSVPPESRVIEFQAISFEAAIMKFVWQHGSITRREIDRLFPIYKPPARTLPKMLEYGTLIAGGSAHNRGYMLPPEDSTPAEMLPPEPSLDTFWMMPGWLLAGNGLSIWQAQASEQVHFLSGKGITLILNVLINDFEDGAKCAKAVQASGTSIRLQIARLLARRRIQGMEELLFAIDHALEQREVVFLSAHGIEQATAIAACFLVHRGATGPEALKKITELRQSGFEPWHTYPRTRQWRQLVLRWARDFQHG